MTHSKDSINKTELVEGLKYIACGLAFSVCAFFTGNVTGCTDMVIHQAEKDIKTSTTIPRMNNEQARFDEQAAHANKQIAQWRAEGVLK